MNRILLCAVAVALVAGCSDPAPTMSPEETAEAQARLLQRTDPVGQFPKVTREEIIPDLEGLTTTSVSDVAGAVAAEKIFDRARRAVRLTEGQQLAEDGPALREKLIPLLKQKQTQLYPAMRRSYAAHMESETAGLQVNFRAVGARNKTLRAASPNFSSEDVVMQVQQTLMSKAIKFRFTRMEYVYSLTGASRYSTINGDADDDIGL